jgi:mitochondrial fission protein ELM1
MRILILADRRTGHVRHCLGLVRVIERDRSVETVELAIRPHRLAPDIVRRLAAAFPGLSPQQSLKRCYGIGASEVSGFDLVIGSGRPTILAGLLISRLTGAKFVYCGRASGYDPKEFGLVLVPYRGEADLPQYACGPIPSPVDPENYGPPRPLVSVDALMGANVTLLVGGPSSRRGWASIDWARLAYFIVAAEHQLGVRWSIATSPRTPEAARGLLAATFSALEHGGAFVDFQKEGRGSADRLLGGDAICVTSDSTSMIAEGLAAMRPVIGIASRRLKTSRDDRYLADLASEGSFADLPLASLTPDVFASTLTGLVLPNVDPRDRLREALAGVLTSIG